MNTSTKDEGNEIAAGEVYELKCIKKGRVIADHTSHV